MIRIDEPPSPVQPILGHENVATTTLEATHVRQVLLIDEAQEMPTAVLNELRLLSSDRFDSRSLLTVVLAGDGRLVAKLGREELLPLGSRIRVRLPFEPVGCEDDRRDTGAPDRRGGEPDADERRSW